MTGQMLANKEKADSLAAQENQSAPKEVLRRMRNAISTNIGLYEIRMNLFLWGLFRMGRQKES